MVLSVGSQLFDYKTFPGVTSADGRSGALGLEQKSEPVGDSFQNNIPDDILNLSSDVFETLSSGIRGLRQADADLARQRLQAAEELLSFTRNLLGASSDDQREIILGGVRELGQSLESLVTQLSQLFSGSNESGEVSYAETLSAEFNFTSISVSEETLEINQTDGGLEVKRTLEQTQIVIAELDVERAQTLSLRSNGDLPALLSSGTQLENIIDDFRSVLQDFQSLVKELLKSFTKDEILPELPVDILQNFLEQVQEYPREA